MAASIAVILSEDRTEVLLVERADMPVWVLPGGGIDPGETPEKTAVREVLEETGLTTAIVKSLAEFTPVNRLAEPTYLYEMRPLFGALRCSSESRNVAYFPLDALPRSFFVAHRDWLHEVLKAKELPVRRALKEINYLRAFFGLLRHPILVFRWCAGRLRRASR